MRGARKAPRKRRKACPSCSPEEDKQTVKLMMKSDHVTRTTRTSIEHNKRRAAWLKGRDPIALTRFAQPLPDTTLKIRVRNSLLPTERAYIHWWASNPSRSSRKIHPEQAYGSYSNQGWARIKRTSQWAQISLHLAFPSAYTVGRVKYPPHVHFDIGGKVYTVELPRVRSAYERL